MSRPVTVEDTTPDEDHQHNEPDYDGRARKRPPGASSTVRAIYALLVEHPEGVTVSDLQELMAPDWTANVCFPAYEQHLKDARMREANASPSLISPAHPKFIDKARYWWIGTRLQSMKSVNSARREGTGRDAVWFKGDREEAPREIVNCEAGKVHLQEMDIDRSARSLRDQVNREKIKEACRDAQKKRVKRSHLTQGDIAAWALVDMVEDWLAGRL